jgi:hypothetical protein
VVHRTVVVVIWYAVKKIEDVSSVPGRALYFGEGQTQSYLLTKESYMCILFSITTFWKTPQHRQKCNEKGEILFNTFVFFHIATKVLSFAQLSPTSVFF